MLGEEGSGLLTQDKPYVCVPLSRVVSAVSQVVALQEAISHAEDRAFEKYPKRKRPPSVEEGVNKCPGIYRGQRSGSLLQIYISTRGKGFKQRITSNPFLKTIFP